MGCLNGLILFQAFCCLQGITSQFLKKSFQDWPIRKFQFIFITVCLSLMAPQELPMVYFIKYTLGLTYCPSVLQSVFSWSSHAGPPLPAPEHPQSTTGQQPPNGLALCSAPGVNFHQFELYLHEPQNKPQPTDEEKPHFFIWIQVPDLYHFPSPWRTY